MLNNYYYTVLVQQRKTTEVSLRSLLKSSFPSDLNHKGNTRFVSGVYTEESTFRSTHESLAEDLSWGPRPSLDYMWERYHRCRGARKCLHPKLKYWSSSLIQKLVHSLLWSCTPELLFSIGPTSIPLPVTLLVKQMTKATSGHRRVIVRTAEHTCFPELGKDLYKTGPHERNWLPLLTCSELQPAPLVT